MAFITLYEMLAAPREAPAIRRLQRHAPVAVTAAERSTDLSPVAAALAGLAGRLIATPSPALGRALLPLAVLGAVLGGAFFGLALQGLRVPAVAWALLTGLVPVNTVILSRLYGYDTGFAATVLTVPS